MSDFSCFVCRATSFEGEQSFLVEHTIHGTIKLCVMCGAAAERLGWIIKLNQ